MQQVHKRNARWKFGLRRTLLWVNTIILADLSVLLLPCERGGMSTSKAVMRQKHTTFSESKSGEKFTAALPKLLL